MKLGGKIFEYLKSCEAETIALIEELCRIPAPSWGEERRAEFCRDWLERCGAEGVYIDDALNTVYPVGCEGNDDIVVFMAHTDTVFPDTEPMPCSSDGEYIYSPGVGDDTACLAVLLMIARFVAKNHLTSRHGILFVADSGEEGLGNLKGVRQIMKDYEGRISELYSFDGTYDSVVNKCVGSHRYELTFKTQGGHSYGDFGNKNAIHAMSSLICSLYDCKVPSDNESKTTYNVGVVEGGTSVNTIAEGAKMLYEYRSDSEKCLEDMRVFFESAVAEARQDTDVEIDVRVVGIRPCGSGVDEEHLSEMTKKAVEISEKHSGLKCAVKSGSTDANIPMSLGVAAITLGAYLGSGAHTRDERVLISSIPVGLKIAAELILSYF
ncbi:MAG: M20/M25/M40 family metallo-hydrolase [Clostridia bacterium]|nr:M20/M25/M40 family metallo-hydrolase [Clostridia bacterium]MBQ8720061.1 M20/M25/M40 family metallo-hydrolase [Clostridia bacterium]